MAISPGGFRGFLRSSYPGGMVKNPARVAPRRQSVASEAILRSLAKEPEDAGLTGGTRSLERRLLALNFGVSVSKLESVKQRVGLRSEAA